MSNRQRCSEEPSLNEEVRCVRVFGSGNCFDGGWGGGGGGVGTSTTINPV